MFLYLDDNLVDAALMRRLVDAGHDILPPLLPARRQIVQLDSAEADFLV
jgi:hypothetical protein